MSEEQPGEAKFEIGELPTLKRSHVIAGRIRSRIVSGELAQGHNLPTESALLQRLNVSRPVLREALRILEGEGLIRTGRGTRHPVVLGPSIQKSAQFASYLLAGDAVTLGDLHRARLLVEPEIVHSIGGERLQWTARELTRCVESFDSSDPDDILDSITLSKRFHEILMNASTNPVLRTICRMFYEIAMHSYQVLIEGSARDLEALRRHQSVQHAAYRQLVAHLASGDTEHAAAGWTEYILATDRMLDSSGLASRPLVALG